MMQKIGSWIGFLISLVALLWLVQTYDFKEMLPHLESARYIYFVPVPLLLTVNFILRAARWRLLYASGHPATLANFFYAMMIGNLFNNALPARSGEFIKIYLLGKTAGLSKSRILATVVVQKAADLLIAIGLLAVLLAVYPVPEWARKAGLVVAVIAFAAICFIIILGFSGNKLTTVLLRGLDFLPFHIKTRIEAAMQQFTIGLSGLISARRASYFMCFSTIIWALELVVMYAVARAFSIEVSLVDLLFIMLMILFGTMVPSSPGYIGTFEFFGLNALAVLGITGGGALGFVVVLHATLLLGSSLLGIGCLAKQGWPRVSTSLAENTK